jgi:protocatechuate 3,4-dioxygenase beta subunit
MSNISRRSFLKRSALGIAAAGTAGLVLSADARPTESSGKLSSFGRELLEQLEEEMSRERKWAPTTSSELGSYYIKGAPYRAKVSPPLASGTALVISGHVWGYDTRTPLANAVIDIWHADSKGRYGGYNQQNPYEKQLFKNRARLVTDESGYYEFETIHPGHYKTENGQWKPSHIHYLVWHGGYKTLTTRIFFRGDPYLDREKEVKESLIIDLQYVKTEKGFYEKGIFDIVLLPLMR